MNRLLFFYSMPHMGQQGPMQKTASALRPGGLGVSGAALGAERLIRAKVRRFRESPAQ